MWTNLNVTSLVTWFVTVMFAALSGTMYMRKPFYVYHEEMRRTHKFTTLPAWAYKVAWPIIIGFDIASLFLFFNYNYEACAQTYYIVATAFSLATLFGMVLWAPTFIKWSSALGGFIVISWTFSCAAVVLGMMAASITNNGCPAVSTTYPTGVIAAVLWSIQLIWFAIQIYTSWRWLYLPKEHRSFKYWYWHHKKLVHMRIKAWWEKKYGYNRDNGYGSHDMEPKPEMMSDYEEDENYHTGSRHHKKSSATHGDDWAMSMAAIGAMAAPLVRKPVTKNE